MRPDKLHSGPWDSWSGAAWVFIRSGDHWVQQRSKLVGSNENRGYIGVGRLDVGLQGMSVALSADGNTAIVGGPHDNDAAGAAWVFTRKDGVWTQLIKLTGSDAVGGTSKGAVKGALQGEGVALSADGKTAIVGGLGDSEVGAAWVFYTPMSTPPASADSGSSQGPIPQTADDVPASDCDTYAADPIDPQRKATGVPVERLNPALAIPACESAVRQYPSSNRLIFQLGRAYQKKTDFNSALILYRKATERGYLPAQFNLGGMYQNGEGVSPDSAKALELWRSSAGQGLAMAQLILGALYATGSGGLRQNNSEALKWIYRAADQGLADAQVLLGKTYQEGRGVVKNFAEAMKWYRKAADQGNATAQNEIGYMHAKGEGVQKNIAEATKWFRKAADQGLEIAKDNLNQADPDIACSRPICSMLSLNSVMKPDRVTWWST
jgi:Sel1 repeat